VICRYDISHEKSVGSVIFLIYCFVVLMGQI
jgi:hypothetical protein